MLSRRQFHSFVAKHIQCFSNKVHLKGRCHGHRRDYTSSQLSKKPFKVLSGECDTSTEQFAQNTARSNAIIEQYRQLLAVATAGGGAKAFDRHMKTNKKMLVWDRLKLLFDDYSSVLEIGTLTGMRMEYGDIPRAGMITAIGKVHGVYCMIGASDATVKGGTLFPVSVKKQLRSQEVAMQNRLPYIFVTDSGGAFLPLQSDIFPDKEQGGRVFYNEAIFNSMGIPQLSIVCGSCTAGAAYIPTMVQESAIVHKIGSIFLAGPPLVKAALGEEVSAEELGGATLHCSVSGYTDHFAPTEDEAYEIGRDVVVTFNIDPVSWDEAYDEPLYSPEELLGLIPSKNQHTMDMYHVLARLVDGSRFHEFKANYGKTVVTGFAHLHGHLVGFVGNNGAMTEQAALKGAHFVQLCDQRNVPLIFLQNTSPDDYLTVLTPELAEEHGGRIRGEAKLMSAVSCAHVPKLCVITGNSFGMGNYTMCGRAFSPNFLFTWPNAQISIEQPADLIKTALELKGSDDPELKEKISKEVFQKSSALYASSRLWSDDIIVPQDTRKVLGKCLEIVKQHPEEKEFKYNVIRM